MPSSSPQPAPEADERLAQLEARIARLEQYVGLAESAALRSAAGEILRPLPKSAEEFELEVGENWFARFGIAALAVGGAFLLLRPYPTLPTALPGLAGLATAAALFAIAHFGRKAFALVTTYLRAAAMALLYCAVLRLYFFGRPVLDAHSVAGTVVLVAAAALNLWIAWRRNSPWLMILALITAAATPLALDSAGATLAGCVALALITAYVGSRPGWRALLPLGIALTVAGYLLWARGDPLLGHAYAWAAEPAGAPLALLAAAAIFAAVPFRVRTASPDDLPAATAALLTCLFGYGAFLVHSYAIDAPRFVLLHVVASALFLGLAAGLWRVRRSQVATFFYAMCGYAALSMAIIRATGLPDMLVWLSLESVLVIATAIWFQSRFIVVTNFAIYVLVVLGYMVLNDRETGVSVGFGVVALVSARVLNWQRHRLALKTELMRNAYLLTAFVIFPYALYHLAPHRYVPLAWVALAVLYYVLNQVIRNQKYRWMGHATLLLTIVYLLIPGHEGLTMPVRIVSLLVLGGVLLIVSLLFTRGHSHRQAAGSKGGG